MILLKIDDSSSVPKYRQVIQSIVDDIENGTLKKDDQLPSINELSEEYYLSRDTVEKAYTELRERGIIISVPRKGYFINKTEELDKINIFLLFNKLSDFKKVIYNAFVQAMGDKGKVNLFIYHNDANVFQELIRENNGAFSYYVIIPHFYDPPFNLAEILGQLPANKLILLDNNPELTGGGEFAAVYQNFEKDIREALQKLKDHIAKYEELILVFPAESHHPDEIRYGFENFCREFSFPYKIVSNVDTAQIRKGQSYVILEEGAMISFLKYVKSSGMKLGEDVGLISYNEDPLKELLLEGITVISTDFEMMGSSAAEMILNKQMLKKENRFNVFVRKSL